MPASLKAATFAAALIASSLAVTVAAFAVPAFADAAAITSDDILWAGSGGGKILFLCKSLLSVIYHQCTHLLHLSI